MAINDYVLPPVQTTADAQVPTGTIKTPFTPAPVYSAPSVADLGAQFDATNPLVSPEETSVTNTNSLINNLLGIQEQSTKEQAQQFNTLGGNEAQAKLKDITAQYNAADLQNQAQQQAYIAARTAGGGGTASGVSTTLEGIQRENAVKKLGLASDAALLQGRVDMAKTLSEQAIKAKYGDIQAQIDSQKAHYELNKDMLIRADKKNYDKQQYILKKQQEELDAKKANDKVVSDMLIEASPVAPPDIIANAKAIKLKGGSPTDIAMALGQYGGDYYKTALLKEQIETQKSNRLTDAAQRAKLYQDVAESKAKMNNATVITGKDGVIATLPKASQDRYYKMQGDFDTATKTYRGAIDAAGSVKALSKNASPQDQTAIIFQYMKTLDPNSTVREGEFALVAATAGLGDRAVNALKRLDNGQRLNEAQIKDIVGATDKLAANAKANLSATSKEYDRRATIQGLPKGLFLDTSTQEQVNPNDSLEAQAIKAKMEAANPALKKQVFEGTSIINNIKGTAIDFTIPTIKTN